MRRTIFNGACSIHLRYDARGELNLLRAAAPSRFHRPRFRALSLLGPLRSMPVNAMSSPLAP